ncbi:ATP-binding cassette subfamily B protein [Melghirimyces profundicolus]|uniref:ATP-binding cassette subfamily B protein n=1 Tax=Melghirimyces profundicolus TaxID=1242148 RepID=A0A2T6C4Q5_9BACL|nr:ABC transporter transmembrane domain-containing protein [Melghirimyces profundicolus]PTX63309.1 ATP-binding cassette subfamily B protein [Melghirimyces profundicolus]
MRIFRDLWWFFKQEKKSYILGVGVLLVVALLEIFPPYVVRLVVDAIEGEKLTTGFLLKWLTLLAVAGITMYILRYFWRILLFGAAFRLGQQLRGELYAHFTRMSPRFFNRRRTGDLMAHATNDVQAVRVTAGEGVLTFVDSLVLGGLVVLSMAVFISWKLTLIALVPMPFMAWAVGRYGKWMHERFLKAQAAFSDINNKVQENISGVRVVKAFGREEAEKRSFHRLSLDVVEKNISVARIDALFGPTISLIVGVSFFLTVAFGAVYVTNGEMTIGQLTQFTLYLGQLIWPMLAFGFLTNIMQRGRASYDRIRSLLNVEPDISDREGAVTRPASGEIRFNLSRFTYPEAETPALHRVQVTVPQGATLGVVGKTGSGKTTLFRLLLREVEGPPGSVSIGGIPVEEYTLSALRSAIGYVPQDHFLFSATIRENIAFGRPEATDGEIERVARLARVHEDILRLEEGYDTLVGERGVTLSGGQKQRLSIARALLLDPEILILDDSLSAVDAKTEEKILESLRKERAGKTTLIAAHRLSGIEHADEILVLEDGAVIERGTHRELLEQEGWYAWMVRRQYLESLIEKGGGADGDEAVARLPQTSS